MFADLSVRARRDIAYGLLDRLLILGVVMLATASTRMVFTGFEPIYTFYGILVVVVTVMRLNRDRLGTGAIAIVVWGAFAFASLASAQQVGLIGGTTPLALVSAIVAAAAFPRREARLFTAILFVPLIVIHAIAMTGWIVPAPDDLLTYAAAPSSWLTALVVLLATGYFTQYVVRKVLASVAMTTVPISIGNAAPAADVYVSADTLPDRRSGRTELRYAGQVSLATLAIIFFVQLLQYGLVGELEATNALIGTLIPLAIAPPALAWASWQSRKYATAFGEVTRMRDNVLHAIYDSMAALSLLRDKETGAHLERCTRYAEFLLRAVVLENRSTFTDADVEVMATAVRLHDVGKVGTPDSILLKPGTLDPDEVAVMRRHASDGAEMIATFAARNDLLDDPVLRVAQDVARSHHENWDGTGYPAGLVGSQIPFSARLMAIIDVYDALRSERPYKRAFDHAEAIGIMKSVAGSKFDPELFETFLTAQEGFATIFEAVQHDSNERR